MTKNWYVREIILILKDPRLCPTCEKDDKFEINVVRENVSRGKTFLCTRCEALTVVTHLNLRRVELSSQIGDNIMLKEPHPIRKVSY